MRGEDYIGHAGKTLDSERFQKCPRPRSLQVGPVGRGLSPTVEGRIGMGLIGPIGPVSFTPIIKILEVSVKFHGSKYSQLFVVDINWPVEASSSTSKSTTAEHVYTATTNNRESYDPIQEKECSKTFCLEKRTRTLPHIPKSNVRAIVPNYLLDYDMSYGP